MDARATSLRRILAQTDRATDRISSIVQRTDAELAELSGLMGPIEARTQRLSNAHKNLTAVHDETEQWLEHLEVSWTSGSTLEREFVDDDDHDALLRGVDALVDAEAFFARRHAYRGAESSRKHCAELLDRHLERCELEFARLLDDHARAAESSREHAAANDPNPNDANPNDPNDPNDPNPDPNRDVGDARVVIPPPPPPVSARSLTPVTPALARFASTDLRTPTQGTPRTPTLSARRAETHHRALFDVSPRLASVARTLRASPAPRVRDARTAASRLYVAARRAALDAAIDRMGHAGLLRDADSVAAPPPPVAPGLGDGSATESRVARWLAGVADAVARWTAEERLAMEIFGENLDGRAAREVVPPILEHAARRALAPVEAFAARVSGDGNRRESREMAFVGRGRAAHARDGDRDAAASDADARHRDLTNTRARGCPEKVFALVRARDALTRARWGVETTLRENGGALQEWRRATAKATTGARRAVAETTATTKHEAARVGAGWERAGADAPERAAAESEGLARSVVAHLARVAELRDARTWLFAEDDAETSEEAEETEAEETEAEETEAIRSPVRASRDGDGEDSDGILDFTDSDDEEVFAPTPAPATRASRTGERIASASSASSSVAAAAAAENEAAMAADSTFAALAADALAAATETFASPRPSTVAPARGKPPNAATFAPPLTPALAAAARAFAVDAVREAAETSESEALRTVLSRSGWFHRSEEMAAERSSAYVSAAWGAAIEAMGIEGAPDPRNMNDKHRQNVKDRFTAVNAAVEDAAASAAATNAATPNERTRRRLADATRATVVGPYREFRARYEKSGFTRKNPEKYLKHAPEALEAIVEASFGSARETR